MQRQRSEQGVHKQRSLKEYRSHQGWVTAVERSSPRASRRSQPCLDLRLLAPRTTRV
jgi:hypothetical protein